MNIDWDKIDSVAGGMTEEELKIESILALGGEYFYNGLTLPNPVAGHFILLEILNNPFIKGGEVSDYNTDEAVFILTMGKDAVSAVFEDVIFSNPVKERVEDFIGEIPSYDRKIINLFLRTYLKYSMNGFEMIPSEDSQPKKMTFDNEWLSTYVSVCNKITGYTADRIIWQMPVLFGGFCIARYAKENGQKSIERPQDWKAIFNELREQIDAQ